MSEPTSPVFFPAPESVLVDPATCEHVQWVPYRKRVMLMEPIISMLATVFVWCPRCNQTRQGPTEEGM